MMVLISLDNSDDRLAQAVWAEYIKAVDKVISSHALKTVESMIHTLPTSSVMSCHWLIEIPDQGFIKSNLKLELGKLAKRFKQDHFAWTECKTRQLISGEGN